MVPLTAHGNTEEMEEGAKEIVAAHSHSPGREGEIYAVPMVTDNEYLIPNDSPLNGRIRRNSIGLGDWDRYGAVAEMDRKQQRVCGGYPCWS